MSEAESAAEVVRPPLQLVRLPVDKPQPAVSFLMGRSCGVMDLIAHFWEELAHTPALQRGDLHLVAATPIDSDNLNINIPQLNPEAFSGAMLYVPKAHRADVLALDPATAGAFAAYISRQGPKALNAEVSASATEKGAESGAAHGGGSGGGGGGVGGGGGGPALSLTDLSAASKRASAATEIPAEMPDPLSKSSPNGRIPIDYLTGGAEGIFWMTPLLLPLVHRKSPHRQSVNVVMQLPAGVETGAEGNVRLAREEDIPTLNRWRRQYKDERGVLFDADMDAWVQNQRVFVYEHENQIAALAKFDLELQNLIEIGGVYTFPEFRHHGYGRAIVRDLAHRIRQTGKTPRLQADEENVPAIKLYETAGWQTMGRIARVWLTG